MGNFPIIGLTIAVVMMIVGFIIYKKKNEKFVNTDEQTNATYEKMRDIPKNPRPYYDHTPGMMTLPYINQFDRPEPNEPSVPQEPSVTQEPSVFPGVPSSTLYTQPNLFRKSDFQSELERYA
jgi:hypothetical protein